MKARTKAVIDIETSGFSKTKNAICEIGIVIIDDKCKVIDEMNVLVEPYDAQYTQKAFEIHRISNSRLEKEGLNPSDVCSEVSKFLEKYEAKTFIGHNIKRFDLPFLRAFFDRFSAIEHLVNFDSFEDTLLIAKTRLNLDSYSLGSLCNYYRVKNEDEHRSIGDCKATIEVYRNLIN